MSKRFTEIMKWNDPWFRRLSIEAKLFWIYLCDNCDNAGVWKIDYELASFQIGGKITNDLLKEINLGKERVKESNDLMLVLDFINFQIGNIQNKKLTNLQINSKRLIEKYISTGFFTTNDFQLMLTGSLPVVNGYKYIGTSTGTSTGTSKGKGEKKLKGKKTLKFDFEAFWKLYPTRNGKKVGKQETLNLFIKSIATPEDYADLISAVKNYRICEQIENGYAKDPIRFLKNNFWKDWLTKNDNPAYVEPEPDNTQHISEADKKIQDEFYKLPPAEQERRKKENAEKLAEILRGAFK